MGTHPVNLLLRFLLELGALWSLGLWAWYQQDGWMRYVLAIGVPLMAATVWGIFKVPGDPSRSGAAPVPVSGMVRLGVEALVFLSATWALYDLGYNRWAIIFGALLLIHYAFSLDRMQWLFNQ